MSASRPLDTAIDLMLGVAAATSADQIGTVLFGFAIGGIIGYQLVMLAHQSAMRHRPDLKATDLNLSISEGELGWHEYRRGQEGDQP